MIVTMNLFLINCVGSVVELVEGLVGRVLIDGDSDRYCHGSNLTRVIVLYPWE